MVESHAKLMVGKEWPDFEKQEVTMNEKRNNVFIFIYRLEYMFPNIIYIVYC